MNKTDLTYLLNKPNAINEKQTMALEIILQQFPFFQSVKALHLKGLYNQESFRYNYELKKTAAHTNDRSILFDFITSDSFTTLQKNTINVQEKTISNLPVVESPVVINEPQIETNNETLELETKIKEEREDIITIEKKLEIGKPLDFNQSEKHSFQEWLQLTKFAPIERENKEKEEVRDDEKLKKIDIIDRFIELNPKISPVKEATPAPINISKSSEEPTHLMTETLAKIYLEQKKYQKAIQAYDILILKYPEKSSFFANRIKDIKNLQQNNN
ncbi:hypothetical protein FIA58_012615 [Flavobacterium jejuense]|uniref:Tetratricopeptide repeat protein n=1 Tax=Flavobacterium jejuense TaxID=1544455 RepID=A0ABX0ITH6_9FLAO|nr:tetratricopeptide repeat protein [Flavobacterium jejuense]NHN26521.1 hypothetical protein [Flavobacterium jejuense]